MLRLVTQNCFSVNELLAKCLIQRIKKNEENHILKSFVGSENLTENSAKTMKETYFKSTYNCLSLPNNLK